MRENLKNASTKSSRNLPCSAQIRPVSFGVPLSARQSPHSSVEGQAVSQPRLTVIGNRNSEKD